MRIRDSIYELRSSEELFILEKQYSGAFDRIDAYRYVTKGFTGYQEYLVENGIYNGVVSKETVAVDRREYLRKLGLVYDFPQQALVTSDITLDFAVLSENTIKVFNFLSINMLNPSTFLYVERIIGNMNLKDSTFTGIIQYSSVKRTQIWES